MPNFSIITVNLNNAGGLYKTIESVQNQTYSDYEFIIIDGGSTDGSLNIINEYSQIFAHRVSEPDSGIYDGMNKGIKYAKGEWIIFMNSGDYFANKNVLEHVFYNKIKADTKIIYGNTIVKDKNKRIKPSAKINKNYFFFETICHQSIFFRRDIFEVIGYYSSDYKIISDKEFLLRAAISKINYTYVDTDVCVWDEIGFASNNHELLHNEATNLINSYFNIFEQILLRIRRKFFLYKVKNTTITY